MRLVSFLGCFLIWRTGPRSKANESCAALLIGNSITCGAATRSEGADQRCPVARRRAQAGPFRRVEVRENLSKGTRCSALNLLLWRSSSAG